MLLPSENSAAAIPAARSTPLLLVPRTVLCSFLCCCCGLVWSSPRSSQPLVPPLTGLLAGGHILAGSALPTALCCRHPPGRLLPLCHRAFCSRAGRRGLCCSSCTWRRGYVRVVLLLCSSRSWRGAKAPASFATCLPGARLLCCCSCWFCSCLMLPLPGFLALLSCCWCSGPSKSRLATYIGCCVLACRHLHRLQCMPRCVLRSRPCASWTVQHALHGAHAPKPSPLHALHSLPALC